MFESIRLFSFIGYLFMIGMLSCLGMMSLLSTSNCKIINKISKAIPKTFEIITWLLILGFVITYTIDLIIYLF